MLCWAVPEKNNLINSGQWRIEFFFTAVAFSDCWTVENLLIKPRLSIIFANTLLDYLGAGIDQELARLWPY
jgi:hypothetical protein